ncbi:MAG: acyl-CoA dehydratase activase [Pseudomonadota bacterium]|nr:acyl-CoA dehydratase activase [Pseudomonadota bacterium]
MSNNHLYVGIDIGSTTAKAVIVDRDGAIMAQTVQRSGYDFAAVARDVFDASLEMAGLQRESVTAIVSTGYGRRNVDFADEQRTEIFCHARGVHYYFPEPVTVVDIGGQDNKVIHIGADGQRLGFTMNRKCAAGTGAFIEEIAYRLDLPLGDLNRMAEEADSEVTIGSFCTVFSCTEILGMARRGIPIDDIIKGVFRSVVKRVAEMDALDGKVVMTGGVVDHNPIVGVMLGEAIGRCVEIPAHPQAIGALGAALIARDLQDK